MAQKVRCKEGYKVISCKSVENHQRQGFCWKGKLSPKRMDKICMSKKKAKKVVKRKKKKATQPAQS